MKEMASRSIKTPYEVKTHIYNHKVALASYQDPWVECKTNLSRGKTEYYLIHRSLQFEQFRIELRDTILENLNQSIKRARGQLGIDTQIIVNGLPTLSDVKIAYHHLQKADLRFAEILEIFRE